VEQKEGKRAPERRKERESEKGGGLPFSNTSLSLYSGAGRLGRGEERAPEKKEKGTRPKGADSAFRFLKLLREL